MAANRVLRAILEERRADISLYRRSYRWLPISVVLFFPIVLVLGSTIHMSVTLLLLLSMAPFFANCAALYYYRDNFFKELIICPDCLGPSIYLSEEWVCGACSKTNRHVAWPTRKTFAEACRFSECKTVPHSIICPGCRNPIVFDEKTFNWQPEQSAWLPGFPPHQKPAALPAPEPTIDDLIPTKDRQKHTLIVTMPQVGKSEAIKCFVHSLLSQPVACFVLDPHGDMAPQIAKWPNKRLIYLEYDLRERYTPTINPFEIHGIDASDFGHGATKVKRVVAQQLSAAIQQMTVDFSVNMQAVLTPCILTLLDMPGATMQDLYHFMIKEKAGPLVQFALTRTHDEVNAEFFRHQFNDQHLNMSKGALRTKLYSLLNTGTFVDLTCGPTTVFLERAWNDKRIVVFNLSKIGDSEAASFGSLVLSLLQGIAKRRAEIDKADRIPCHVFIDECHLFVNRSTPVIMSQSLKWGFTLTLAHQHLGQMSKEIESAIHKLTHLNIVGVNTAIQQRSIAQYFHLEPNDIAALQIGGFIVRIGNGRPFFFTFPTTHLEKRGAMSESDWQKVCNSQLRRFYRPTAAPKKTEPSAPAKADLSALAAQTGLSGVALQLGEAMLRQKQQSEQTPPKPKDDDTAPGTW